MMKRVYNKMVIPEEPKSKNSSCVKYEQLTILEYEPTYALSYIVSRKPTININ